jgi:hypothetical protein
VIAVDMTDDFDDWKYARSAVFDDEGVPVAVSPRQTGPVEFVESPAGAIRLSGRLRVHLALLSRSALYRFLTDRVRASRDPDRVPGGELLNRRWAWCDAEWDEQTAENVSFTLDMVRRAVTLARDAGVEVVVTVVPHYDQFSPRPGVSPTCSLRAVREIERVTLAAGGRFLNSHEPMRAAIEGSGQSRYYYSEDMHFNPRGNALWAQAHIDFLLDPENGLLPER